MDKDNSYRLFMLATDRGNQENTLWGQRTAAFLAANAFLFLGVVELLKSDVTLVLPIIVSSCGILFCLLQNRNAWAARKGNEAWQHMRSQALEGLDAEFAQAVTDAREMTQLAWGATAPTWKNLFIPSKIHEYWLPAAMATIWCASIVVAGLMFG